MDHDRRVDAVERELAGIVAAIESGPLDAMVPTCPDYTVDRLARHIGEFCGFWCHVLCEASTERPKPPFADEPGSEGRAAWLQGIGTSLVAELRATPPDTPCYTWHPTDKAAWFVARRCAHELAVHRVDVQNVRGEPEPVEPDLAADGIEEVLMMMEVFGTQRGRPGSGQTLHLHGTDHQPAEWLVRLRPDGVEVAREHAKGDLALKGAVSDLEMLVYQRPTSGDVEWFGDRSVLEAFHRQFTF